jgi:hypothetical protein
MYRLIVTVYCMVGCVEIEKYLLPKSLLTAVIVNKYFVVIIALDSRLIFLTHFNTLHCVCTVARARADCDCGWLPEFCILGSFSPPSEFRRIASSLHDVSAHSQTEAPSFPILKLASQQFNNSHLSLSYTVYNF